MLATDPQGRSVVVAGSIPGEVVEADVVPAPHGQRRARHALIEVASTSRVIPGCPEVARGCGGCQWQHIALERQRELKHLQVAQSVQRISPASPVAPIRTLPERDYRTTVRAGVVEGRAGLRQARSHDILMVESCLVAHPLIEDLLLEGRFRGAEEVVVRCGARTGERLAWATPGSAEMSVPPDVRTDSITEEVAGRRWQISAQSFFQSRPDGAEALAELVGAMTGDMDVSRAADLYCGVGLYAGVLAERGWEVTAVEVARSSVGDAVHNLSGLPVEVIHEDVGRWRPTPADLVVANPARIGLEKRGVRAVVATGATRVILISCDVKAFERDARGLLRGGYALTSAVPVDMFPHTYHVEVVSVFDRLRSA